MGEIADYYESHYLKEMTMGLGRDYLADRDPPQGPPNRRSRWTCNDGSMTSAAKMTERHLTNAITWLERQPDTMMKTFGDSPDNFDVEEVEWEKDGFSRAE